MSTKSYPLHWPDHWPRTSTGGRRRSNFNTRHDTGAVCRTKRSLTVAEGLRRVLDALRKMGVPSYNVIISTNMQVKGDGLPYSGRRDPEDPGVAVYWRRGDRQECIAIDQYDRLADNLAAIAGTLDALRGIERWGGAAILERAFTGFAALPPAASSTASAWWLVLGVDHSASAADIESAYRRARREAHPDHGGSAEKFDAVQKAWRQARAELMGEGQA